MTSFAQRGTMAVLAVGLLSFPAAAVVLQPLSFVPVTAAVGPLQASDDIALDDYDLLFSGTRIDGLEVTVNNTNAGANDVDVHTRLLDANGNTLVEKTVSTSVGGNTVKNVTVDYATSNQPSVNDVETTEILLEVTA